MKSRYCDDEGKIEIFFEPDCEAAFHATISVLTTLRLTHACTSQKLFMKYNQ